MVIKTTVKDTKFELQRIGNDSLNLQIVDFECLKLEHKEYLPLFRWSSERFGYAYFNYRMQQQRSGNYGKFVNNIKVGCIFEYGQHERILFKGISHGSRRGKCFNGICR
jgi:hypothetical protein